MPQSPTAPRAAKETPNGSTTKPLRSGLRPPSKLKSNKYDHRNHTKNSTGMMVDSGSSDSDEGGDQGRPRQKPRRRKPKNKAKESKNTGSAAAKGLAESSSADKSQRSVERSPRRKPTSKNDDKDGNVEIKSKGRPRHPGRQAMLKFESHGVKMATPKCNDGPLTKQDKSLVEVVTVETRSVVASSAEVKNTACKVTKDTYKQAQVPTRCPEKNAQNCVLNYNSKVKPRESNSNQRRNALDSGEKEVCGQKQEKITRVTTTVCEHSANSNTNICRTNDSQLQSVCSSKHSKLKTPSFCASGSISSACPSNTGCSIPKSGPRAKTITTDAGLRDGNTAVNVNSGDEPSLKGTGAIPTALHGQMGDIIEQHPRQCRDNQDLLQCNSEANVGVEAHNQPAHTVLDLTRMGSGVLVGEQHCSQCTGNIGNMDPCEEGFQSTKTSFIKGTKGNMEGSKVLQEESCTEIRPNVIGNVQESPQRATIMTSNKVAHKGTIIQNETNEIDEQLQSSNHSKLPEISSGRNGALDVKSECNSAPASGPNPNRAAGCELVTVPGRANERQLRKSSAHGVNSVSNKEGLNPPTANVTKSTCSDNDKNSDTKYESFRVNCVTTNDDNNDNISWSDTKDVVDAYCNRNNEDAQQSGVVHDQHVHDKKSVATVDNIQNNSEHDVIGTTNGFSSDLGLKTRNDSIWEGRCQGDLIRDSLDTCAKQTGLMSNKKETCNEVSVIGTLNGDVENTRADGHGVVNATQELSITPSAGYLPCNDNTCRTLLLGSTGSNIDRNVNNNLQMQSITTTTRSSASPSTSDKTGGRTGCGGCSDGEGSLTELDRGSEAENRALLEEQAGESPCCTVKERCHLGKEAILSGETSVKDQLHRNTSEATRTISNEYATSTSSPPVHVPSFTSAVDAVASCTLLPSNTAGQMSRSGEQLAVKPGLIAGELFSGKCVNETKKRNCDQLVSSASSPSHCSSHVKGINEPIVPNSHAVQLPLPSNEENSRDFALHRLHECQVTTKATRSSGNCSGSGNVPPFSQESNNNEVNGPLLLEHVHSESNRSERTDRTKFSPTTTTSNTETHITNNPAKDCPKLDVQITQCTDKDRDAADEEGRCCEAGAMAVAGKAAFLHEDTAEISQRCRGQAMPPQHSHSKPSRDPLKAINCSGSKEPQYQDINNEMCPQEANPCMKSHQCAPSSVKQDTKHEDAFAGEQAQSIKRDGAADKTSNTPVGHDESARNPPEGPPTSLDREQDSDASQQQHQNVIESEIEYAVANSLTTPQATETGPIDFDRSKYEAALASGSLDTAHVNKVLSQQNEGNVVEIEDYSFRYVLLGLYSDNTKESVSGSLKNICTKDTGDKTMASPTQKQQENMVDSYTEFDSGFVQSPPECSESELEFASPAVDTCQNNIASSHPIPDTCQNIPKATQTNGIINTGVISDLSHESKFNAELSPGHNNSSPGDVPVVDSALSQKSKSSGDGLAPVNKNDKVCDPEEAERNRVKSPGMNDTPSVDTCGMSTEQYPDKDGNFSNNVANIKSDLTTVLCDVNDSLMNINHNSAACIEADNHGSKGLNNAPCNFNQKTISPSSNQASPASVPADNMAVVDKQSEMTKTTKIARHETDKSMNNLNKSVTQAEVSKSKMLEASNCADDKADDENRCVFFLSDNDEYENTCDDTLEGIKALKKGSVSDFEDFDPEEDKLSCSSSSREGKESKAAPARSASSHNFQRKDPEKRKAKYGIASFLMESAPLHRATATSSLNVKSECEAKEVLTGATPESENPTLQFPKFKETVVSQTSLHTSYYEDSNEYLNMLNCLNGKNLRRDNSDPCHMTKVGQGDPNVTNDMQRLKNDLEMKELLQNINQFTSQNNNQVETGNDGFDTVTNTENVTSSSMKDSITADDSEPKSLSSEMTESASDNNMMISSTCSSASSSQMEVENGDSECSCSESVKSVATTPTNETLPLMRSPQGNPMKSKFPSPKEKTSKLSRIPKLGGSPKESGIPNKVKVTSGIPSPVGGSPKHGYSSPTTVDVTFRKSNKDGATSPRIDEGYGTLQSSPKKVRHSLCNKLNQIQCIT